MDIFLCSDTAANSVKDNGGLRDAAVLFGGEFYVGIDLLEAGDSIFQFVESGSYDSKAWGGSFSGVEVARDLLHEGFKQGKPGCDSPA